MKVDIVVTAPDLPWIAGRFARELVARLPAHGIEARINATDHGWADCTYHQIVYGPPARRPAVGLFTHGSDRPRMFADCYDGHIALNSAVHSYLIAAGAPSPVTITPVVDTSLFSLSRPLRFGVAGRTYPDGRKGEHLIAAMVAAGYSVVAWGHGWPCPIYSTDLAALPEFYRSLDYYVDTSYDEGGCVPAIEAMALGIPVISHTVGISRPVISYERGSWESLSAVLAALTRPRTYDDWASEHAAYFKFVGADR